MSRENAAVKARRLVAEGRVVVTVARGRRIRAVVRGDSGAVYEILHDRGSWLCPCPAVGVCSHVQAVQLVTAPVRLGVTL
jgi:uncharacterized Zn finger protein